LPTEKYRKRPLGYTTNILGLSEKLWPEEKVAAWQTQLFLQSLSGLDAEERIDNCIILSKDIHEAWNKGAFILKSISENRITLTVQFFWQNRQTNTQPPISLTTISYSTENLNAFGNSFKLIKEVRSGDIYKLKTNDPVRKPLPSFVLLELR
jgi:hypothetical protein